MAIDLILAGLMILCPKHPGSTCNEDGSNTLWVVDGGLAFTCGRLQNDPTSLEIIFETKKFRENKRCKERAASKDQVVCIFDTPPKKLCIEMNESNRRTDFNSDSIISIQQVDKRFMDWDRPKLQELSTSVITFPNADIFAGRLVPSAPQSGYWKTSQMGPLSPALASDIIARVDRAHDFKLTNCSGSILLDISLKSLPSQSAGNPSQITIRNKTKKINTTRTSHGYEDLEYLLWYHRMGFWYGSKKCPSMSSKKPPLVLRCKNPPTGRTCAWILDAASTMWPPVIR